MAKISKILSSYLIKNAEHIEKIEGLTDKIEEFFIDLGEEFEDIREIFITDIKDYTYEVSEEELKEAVKNLQHKDGTVSGMKWSIEEIENVNKQYNIKDKFAELGLNYCPLYFWFAMNYVYATHFNTNRTITGYIELAVDELANKNVCFDHIMKDIAKHM